MEEKTLYILGAGCSVENGVPLIKDFFEKMSEIDWSNNDSDMSFNVIYAFHENYFPDSNIEEFLSYLDLHIGLGTKFENYDIKKLREWLIIFIGKYIELKLKGDWQSKNYQYFLKNKLGKNDAVISFNWDIMLDNVKFLENDKNEINYGTDFYSIDLQYKNVSKIEKSGFPLLKLHGSLNWLYCSNCNNRFTAIRQKVILKIQKEEIKCPICKKNILTPVIIPPTFIKNIGGSNTETSVIPIWEEAFKQIIQAHKIVIIGYSFSEDDVHFKHFLRSTLSIKNMLGDIESFPIEVVSYKKYQNEKNEFENHYKKIFEKTNLEIQPKFIYLKFSDYAKTL